MSKYCTLLDRPVTTVKNISGQEEIWGGCRVYGVWHNCDGCPNVVEVGDGSYEEKSNPE